MKELIKQTLKPKNILKLPKLIETYFDYVDTNIPMGAVLKGVGVANKIDVENINSKTITGHNQRIGGLDYLSTTEKKQGKSLKKCLKTIY